MKKKKAYSRQVSPESDRLRKRVAELESFILKQENIKNKLSATNIQKQVILDSITDIAWLKDNRGRYLMVNKAFEKSCATRQNDIIGNTDLDIWPKNLAKKYRSDDRKIIATGKKRMFEEPLINKQGVLFTVETVKTPVFGRKGAVIAVAGIAHDITRRKGAEEEIERLNIFLNSIIENIPNMIFLKDAKELRFVLFNKAGEKLLGYNRSDLIGKNDYDFFTKEQAYFFIKKDRQALSHGDILDIPEERIKTKYKGERILHTKKVPVLDKNGRPEYLLGISEDITESKKIEDKLLDLMQQMEFVLGATKTGLDIIDSDYNMIYIDPAWGKIYGDPTGKKCYDYFMCRRTACPGCGVKKALEVKKPVITEKTLAKEGNRPIEVTSIPFRNNKGEWLVAEVNMDITKRKKAYVEIARLIQAQKLLKESGRQYRALFESANDAIFIADAETGIISDANKKASEMLGMPIKDIIGVHYLKIHPEKDELIYKNIFRSCLNTGKSSNHSLFVVGKRGRHIPVQISTSVVSMRNRKCLMEIFTDITELKNVEESLKNDKSSLESILMQKRDDLTLALKDLEDAKRLSDIGSLSAMIAHELRNPLGVIRAAVYNITQKLKGRCSEGIEQHIANIEKKISESDRIINNLLSYSKIMSPYLEDVAPHDVIKECVDNFNMKYSGHKLKLKVDCAVVKRVTIKADRVHMVGLLSNLLDNAFEALPEGTGSIYIGYSYHAKAKKISIKVKDNGSGMTKEDIGRAFDPFFTRKVKGVGLGLSVCKQIITLHNGEINIKSIKSKGTIVTITFPICCK
jgi:PAS domain S-box-containing protein